MKTAPACLFRRLLVTVCFGLASVQVWAGSVVGRVNDINTGASVTGATVTEAATGRSVNADREGEFRLDNLAAGTVMLRISSVGYETKSEKVEVPASGNVALQVQLGDKVVKLEKLVVEGYREGWAKALQQKRNATNLKDILSADAAGNLPDNNVGEALARLPGVSLDVDYGEGHFVSIRGTSPNLNTVTMNGATLATPAELGRTGRSTPMDMLGTALINQVEVIKTLTPDMDGTSLGGTINILTPSGFDHQGQFIKGSVIYGENQADNKPVYGAGISYTNVFGNNGKKLGVALTASYDRRHTREDMLMNQWSGNASQPVLFEPRLDYNLDERKKWSTALNLDYRLEDGTRIYFNVFYNKFNEDNTKNEQLYTSQGTATQLTPTEASFPSVRYDLRLISFLRESQMTNLVFGGTKLIGDYKITAEATYSDAPDKQPVYRNFSFRSGTTTVPGGYIINYGSQFPTFDLSSLVSTANPAARQVRGDMIDNEEKTTTARVDIQRDFTWLEDKSGFFKVGGKYTSRHRSDVRTVGIYQAPGLKLSDFDPSITSPMPTLVLDGRYTMPNIIDGNVARAAFDSFLAQNKLVYDRTGSLSNVSDDTYDVVEKITAAYAMTSFDLTPKLTVLAGFRYEQTHAPLSGPLYYVDQFGVSQLAYKTVTFNYGEALPNVQMRYKLSKSTLLRAAITKTFGRPGYNDQVPSSTLDTLNGVLTTGNPLLKSFESINYDASIDHYFKDGGILSLAWFYKDIANPVYTYSYTLFNTTYQGFFFPSLTVQSKQNGQSANVGGVELSLQLPFSAIVSGFADGFGVDFNASFMESSVKVSTRPGEDLNLFESPKRIINAGLFYEKYGVSARLAYNYKSDSLQSIGTNAYTDIYNSARFFWDAQVGYKITANYSVFLNWQNITDEKTNSYTASNKNHLYQSFWYGSNIRGGMRFQF